MLSVSSWQVMYHLKSSMLLLTLFFCLCISLCSLCQDSFQQAKQVCIHPMDTNKCECVWPWESGREAKQTMQLVFTLARKHLFGNLGFVVVVVGLGIQMGERTSIAKHGKAIQE